MKTIAIGLIAAAAALAGCTATSAGPEQATAPAAGAPLTYPAHDMGEFDAARSEADDYCYKKNDLRRAVYVSRTFETANFECAAR